MSSFTENPDFRTVLSSLIFGVWLVVVSALFWFFQYQYESVWVSFDGDSLPAMDNSKGLVQVVHFVDPTCPCSKFSRPHIEEIEATFKADIRGTDRKFSLTRFTLKKRMRLRICSKGSSQRRQLLRFGGEMVSLCFLDLIHPESFVVKARIY